MKTLSDRSGKLPMAAIIAGALVLVLAIGAFAFLKMHKGSKKHEKKKVDYVEWKFDDMLVTLSDSPEMHYLKLNMTMEMEYKDKSKAPAEGAEDAERPKALDTINSVLSSKTLAKLQPEEGKNKLKEELKKKLNAKLENSQVHEIYFTYFALQ